MRLHQESETAVSYDITDMPPIKPFLLMESRVSIIITTRNRAEHLRETLASFQGLHVPKGLPAELLVVDNASTDETPAVVHNTRLSQMPVRYISEPRAGKGYAYNTGMAAANGEFFLFTDDDVRVPRVWLEAMLAPIVDGSVHAVAGGVMLAPSLERSWMTPELRSCLADTSSLDPSAPSYLVGANMAFARSVLSSVPRFDEELGPGGLGYGDETLFGMQMLAAGYRIGAALDVKVEHHFSPDRLARRSLLGMARAMGRSRAYLRHHWQHQQHQHSLVKTCRAWFDLVAFQMSHPRELWRNEGVTEMEFALVRRLHFHRECIREARRPRNYIKHGLVKVCPTGSFSGTKPSEAFRLHS
jgi:glycosyltransferase involved in cell wall biosynthesis